MPQAKLWTLLFHQKEFTSAHAFSFFHLYPHLAINYCHPASCHTYTLSLVILDQTKNLTPWSYMNKPHFQTSLQL